MGKDRKSPDQLFKEAKGKFKEHYDALLSMKESEKLDEIIESIKDYVKAYVKGVSTSQLRNIYAKIKPLKKEADINQLKLERPKIAYIIARQNDERAVAMMLVIDDLMKSVNTKPQLENFQYFMESVVAYHKFYDKVGTN